MTELIPNLPDPCDTSPSPLLLLPNTFRAFYGGFAHLHPLQRRAVLPILQGLDLVLQSATGSGKTEAVLAPCMERVMRSGREEAVVYVVPTRALAMDLQRRLAPIVVERLGLSMGVRTGDVKRAGGGRADLMLTTPESLDVLLGSSNQELERFVPRIRTVVVDEIHPLLHHVRGRQLAHVLRRLECRTGRPVQKIAVSATIADVDAILSFFHFSPHAVHLLDRVQRSIVPHLVHLKRDEEFLALLDDLHKSHGYRKILLFANSRGQCDRIFELVRSQGSFQGVAELHYSNLKARERRAVEARFRRRAQALCIATSTLELGIDVGDVDGVVLYDPPDSVTAFLQRIGRSNRRGASTHFWGICRGEQAGAQLLRFLALLNLAREGTVERPLPNDFPSVLIQQTLSCLYRHKRISLGAMQALFSDDREDLEILFPAMEREGWLRQDRSTASMRAACPSEGGFGRGCDGLYRGGRRYGKDLVDLRIWSNFPESEEDYTLEVSGEAVADLPRSIVRQLEPGDRVHLAGRPIQVLEIVDWGERKRVVANPVEQIDDKKILWLGTGFQVPFEVAQAMRGVLNPEKEDAGPGEPGLFRRTRRLLEEERSRRKRWVTLANGIVVWRDPRGFYRYDTFLGSMGNLVLRFAVEAAMGDLEGFSVRSHEMGLTCSHWIDFQKLSLPLDRNEFEGWVGENLRSLRFLLPLNGFAQGLPRSLLLKEVAGFVHDARVADHFSRYRSLPSTVVSGDPRSLEWVREESDPVSVFLQGAACPPLLARERERWLRDTEEAMFELPADVRHVARALTGTMVGDHFHHHQCARRWSFLFLPPGLQCRPRGGRDEDVQERRLRSGREFERRVTAALAESGAFLVPMRERDGHGRLLPMETRFDETREQLRTLMPRLDSQRSCYLLQPVLHIPALLKEHFQADVFVSRARDGGRHPHAPSISLLDHIHGTGIPDWIRVSGAPDSPLLEVGDIKDSAGPRESQKWQVAFYAHLLKEAVRGAGFPVGMRVSCTGRLITPSRRGLEEALVHAFDLAPFMAALPALFHNMGAVLLQNPSQAAWHLQESCITCSCFERCYGQALKQETVRLVPRLSRGALQKLRALGLAKLEDAQEWLNASRDEPGTARDLSIAKKQDPFEPHERERLAGRVKALTANGVIRRGRRTRRFPSSLSTAVFVHLTEDPVSNLPRTVGYLAVDEAGTSIARGTWAVAGEEDLSTVWQGFEAGVAGVWRGSAIQGKGPHLFYTDEKVGKGLERWAESAGHAIPVSPLWQRESPHRSDLLTLLREHLDLPLPGRWTLFGLATILGFSVPCGPTGENAWESRESLFHPDPVPHVAPDAWEIRRDLREEAVLHLETALRLQARIWGWARVRLESEWEQTRWQKPSENEGVKTSSMAYVHFLEEERRLRREDVLSLQEYSLEARVERFRALGPLAFEHTRLDDEGRFLHTFRLLHGYGPSKFREDDFLKLAPVGIADLQNGYSVVLAQYEPGEDRVSVISRQGALPVNKRLTYSLEEDLTDWNHEKLAAVVKAVLGAPGEHPAAQILWGRWSRNPGREELLWVEKLIEDFEPLRELNASQRRALELPFRKSPALIEGPPGTGKTHLLGWILIALILRARERGNPLRIVVSALTHQAIDGVLRKVWDLVRRHAMKDFPARLFKWGRWKGASLGGADGEEEDQGGRPQVEELKDWEEASRVPHFILGATGFGMHNLFKGQMDAFARVFDWVVFDEASQILVPQALLSLVHGKGNALFLGDVNQLPPIVLGRQIQRAREEPVSLENLAESAPPKEDFSWKVEHSILGHLLEQYGGEHRVRLHESYRMNAEICAFPSAMWYEGELHAAPGNARSRLLLNVDQKNCPDPGVKPSSVRYLFEKDDGGRPSVLSVNGGGDRRNEAGSPMAEGRHGWEEEVLERILHPHAPVVLVLTDHEGCRQKSDVEVEVVARLACRLMTVHGLASDRMALISPHRAHNNATARHLRELLGGSELSLPVMDTVERLQGAERDVIFFSLTTSDPDHAMSPFLNNPNRFNVALTRAKTKLVVVGSRAFFFQVPETEEALEANRCFKEFYRFCRRRGSVVVWTQQARHAVRLEQPCPDASKEGICSMER